MTLGYKDIEIRKSEFVAKTQFLCKENLIGKFWEQRSFPPNCLKTHLLKRSKFIKSSYFNF